MTRSRKQRKARKQRLKQGAAVSRQPESLYPICPDCGRRHAPDTDDDDASDSVHFHTTISSWVEPDGVHTMLPADLYEGPETLEKLNESIQRKIRESPEWDQLVKQLGPEEAEELLRQCRTELR